MNKTATKILMNITRKNGLCHTGTIAADTGYNIATVKRWLTRLETAGEIKNIPIDGISSWIIA